MNPPWTELTELSWSNGARSPAIGSMLLGSMSKFALKDTVATGRMDFMSV